VKIAIVEHGAHCERNVCRERLTRSR